MERTYVIIICILINSCIYSQNQSEWAPIGAKWTYDYPFSYGNALSYITIESVSDTIIQGISCKVLKQTCVVDASLNRDFYTYGYQDSVWLFDGSIFRLLYDFRAETGNTWEIYGPNFYGVGSICDTLTNAKVDSTGIEEINGNNYNYLFVSFQEFEWQFSLCNSFGNKISAKFGSYGYMFPLQICMIDAPYPCELRCYEDPEFGHYQITTYDSCTYEHGVGVKEIDQSSSIKVFPNPISDYMSIDMVENFTTAQLEIYSFDGRILKNIQLEAGHTVLNLSDLKSGCYFLKFNVDHKFSQSRIIKL